MIRCFLPLLGCFCAVQQAFAGPIMPPPNLSNVIITGGNIAGANASNALVTTRLGGLSSTLAGRIGAWCDPVQDFGADPTGVIDSAAAINLCLATGTPTRLPAGTFLISSGPVILQNGSVLQGAGIALTSLQLGNSKNFDVVQSYNADAWVGTNVRNGTNDWSLSDLTINGNAGNQTATGTARDLANGLTIYGWHWKIYNLLIENVLGHGMRTDSYQYGPTAAAGAEIESHVDRVTIDTVNRHGWWNNAPGNDARNIIVVNAGQEADRTYDGFYFTAGGEYYDLHAWYRTGTPGPRMAYDLYTKGGVNVANSLLEGAGIGWVYHGGGSTIQSQGDRITNSLFMNNDGAANSGGEVFASNGNSSIGNQYFCNTSASSNLNIAGVDIYAMQIGVAGGAPAQYNRISNAVFMGCSDLSPLNMQNSGGYNLVSGVSNGISGGSGGIGGNQGNSDSVSINQSNTALSTTQDFSANSRITGSTLGDFIGGGSSHSAAGWYNVIAGGANNTVSGRYSGIPGGENANDRGLYGRLCFQSGADISNLGDHQVCWQTLSGSLSGAGSVEMLTGSDQTAPSASNTLALPVNNLSYGFSCEVNVINPSNGDAGQFYIDHALISRATGVASVSVNGATSSVPLSPGAAIGTIAAAGISVAAIADTTLGGLNLTATETGSLSLHFSATCETREVQ